MGVITKAMRHDLVLWRAKGQTGDGELIYDHPIEILGRWDDGTIEFLDADGSTQISTAQAIVDRDVKPCDLIRKGTLKSTKYLIDPTKNSDAYEVRAFERVEKLRASDEVFRNAIMKPLRS